MLEARFELISGKKTDIFYDLTKNEQILFVMFTGFRWHLRLS